MAIIFISTHTPVDACEDEIYLGSSLRCCSSIATNVVLMTRIVERLMGTIVAVVCTVVGWLVSGIAIAFCAVSC